MTDPAPAHVAHPPPEPSSELVLHERLVSDWGLEPSAIRYEPKGAGSFHWAVHADTAQYFVTVDDLDTKPWIAHARDDAFVGLRRVYSAAADLHHRHGLEFVVPVISTLRGGAVLRLDDRYAMSVYPLVEGVPGTWGDPIETSLARELLRDLVMLHSVPPHAVDLPTRPLALPERADLDLLVARAANSWSAGPYSAEARTALVESTSFDRWIAEFDSLGARLEESRQEPVVTHGEPHPGNIVHAPEGIRLVDWDTVALAPPERDLWMLGMATPRLLAAYEELSGRELSEDALRFFALMWSLSDVAWLVQAFHSPHAATEGARENLGSLVQLLSGRQTTPYGPPRGGAG